MRPLNIDLATVLGIVALFVVKALVLGHYKWPKEHWQRWVVATAVGLAVAVTAKVFLR
jgi:hypothetical protein